MERIREYFADKTVLLTGATGLVGRVLVEKVLRDLPNIRRLYLLIRPKVGRSGRTLAVEERLGGDFLGSSVFDALRELRGDDFRSLVQEKVAAVAGDLGQERLGLDAETHQQLQDEVQVIINCGAVVTFDAPLDVALRINTLGPLRLLEFAKGCRNFPILAHVSTCYVSGPRQGLVAEEPLDPRKAVAHFNGATGPSYDVDEEVAALTRLVEQVEQCARRPWHRAASAWAARGQRNGGEGGGPPGAEPHRRVWVEQRLVAEGMQRARRRGWNDTYTYTKAMGEQLLARHRGEVPVLVLRPSIVEGSLERPVPGWLDGMRMIDPLIVAYGRNLLPDFPGDPESVLDIIPVDMVVNALLVAIAQGPQKGGLTVYQVATGTENPIMVKTFVDLAQDYFREHSLTGRAQPTVGLPRMTFPTPQRFHRRLRYRYLFPLRLVEALALGVAWMPWGRALRSRFRSRRKSVERLQYYARILSPYAMVRCRYLSQHVRELWANLSPEERQDFNFDVQSIRWPHYVQEVHIPGLQRFVLGVAPRSSPIPRSQEDGLQEQPETLLGVVKGDGVLPFHQEQAPAAAIATLPAQTGAARPGRMRTAVAGALPEREVEFWMGSSLWGGVARAVTRRLFGLGFRFYLGMTCEGLEHVPKSGPFLVASNHNSHVDTAALLVLLGKGGRPLHPVAAKDYFFRSRWRSWASRMFLGAIPFDRQSAALESLGLAVELLRRDHSLIFFPEGGRSQDGKIRPFKRGIGFLALESGVPILPVRIEGSFQALPKGRFFLRRHPIRVRIGPPIPMEPYLQVVGTQGAQELARRVTEDVEMAVEALA